MSSTMNKSRAKLTPGRQVYTRSGKTGILSRVTANGRAVIRSGRACFCPPASEVFNRRPLANKYETPKPETELSQADIYRLAAANGLTYEEAMEAVR